MVCTCACTTYLYMWVCACSKFCFISNKIFLKIVVRFDRQWKILRVCFFLTSISLRLKNYKIISWNFEIDHVLERPHFSTANVVHEVKTLRESLIKVKASDSYMANSQVDDSSPSLFHFLTLDPWRERMWFWISSPI